MGEMKKEMRKCSNCEIVATARDTVDELKRKLSLMEAELNKLELFILNQQGEKKKLQVRVEELKKELKEMDEFYGGE